MYNMRKMLKKLKKKKIIIFISFRILRIVSEFCWKIISNLVIRIS